jgi:UDP-2,3-diacylglucosamine pyrophosphatase LpxH
MRNIEDLFILSDLHLAAERDKGLFQSDLELAACLRWIFTDTRDSVTVLAGDILDFLVLADGNTNVDLARLGEHTQEIIDHHPEVFTALAELAASPRHQLVIMGGNHDAELAFPPVQEAIERRLGVGFLDRPVRWLVHGEALRVRVGDAVTLVEHGNVLDPWNRINHATLQSACSLSSRNLADAGDYQPPLGSRLVLEVVSRLRGSYQWVDCLKPETEAVLPLLWHFASRQQQKLIFGLAEEYLSMKAFEVVKKHGNARNPERLYKGDKEVEDTPRDRDFKEWLDGVYPQLNGQQRLTLGADKKQDKLIRRLRLVSARDTFFEPDAPDESANYLRPVYEGGADLVVHGHTHSAKLCALEGGLYINTGTWGQLLRLPPSYENDESWESFLDLLRKNDVECSSRPTFARVRHEPGGSVTTAALLQWRRQGPEAIAVRRFSDRLSGWRKD